MNIHTLSSDKVEVEEQDQISVAGRDLKFPAQDCETLTGLIQNRVITNPDGSMLTLVSKVISLFNANIARGHVSPKEMNILLANR